MRNAQAILSNSIQSGSGSFKSKDCQQNALDNLATFYYLQFETRHLMELFRLSLIQSVHLLCSDKTTIDWFWGSEIAKGLVGQCNAAAASKIYFLFLLCFLSFAYSFYYYIFFTVEIKTKWDAINKVKKSRCKISSSRNSWISREVAKNSWPAGKMQVCILWRNLLLKLRQMAPRWK